MTQAVTVIPAESDLLCEGCGYTLSGLPQSGNCPECGRPIVQSLGTHRQYTEFEASPSVRTFLRTSWRVLMRPTQFYRTLITRTSSAKARRFHEWHGTAAALLFGIAAHVHIAALSGLSWEAAFRGRWQWLALAGCAMVLLLGMTALAARLSAWEAGYRGMRLPLAVVRRGMYYHTPHYLPVAIVILLTVLAYYNFRWIWFVRGWYFTYLVVLCVEIVLGAVYLFLTYWIAMKNMMYANR
jgi:hypothetical protein